MAVPLKRLIEQVAHMDITLTAGKSGLDQMVGWVHMVETIEACEFLDGGEIAITTGLGLSTGITLTELIQCLHSNRVAALVINLGPYIETISEEALEFCNANDFPLFTVPWRVHIAEIIRIFSFTIAKSDQRDLELAAAFKNAVFFPKHEELYLVPLRKNDIAAQWTYCAVVLKIRGISRKAEHRLESICNALSNYLCHYYKNYFLLILEGRLLLVLANYQDDDTHRLITTVLTFLNKILDSKESVCCGVGKHTRSIRCLYKSYEQAMAVQKLQAKGTFPPEQIYYEDMGIYKLLMAIDDKEILEDYYRKTLQPILSYDKEQNSDLVKILLSYLNNNGSVKKTAAELYVHRNSINYKLHKISELLSADLSDLDIRLQLKVAIMLQDIRRAPF